MHFGSKQDDDRLHSVFPRNRIYRYATSKVHRTGVAEACCCLIAALFNGVNVVLAPLPESPPTAFAFR